MPLPITSFVEFFVTPPSLKRKETLKLPLSVTTESEMPSLCRESTNWREGLANTVDPSVEKFNRFCPPDLVSRRADLDLSDLVAGEEEALVQHPAVASTSAPYGQRRFIQLQDADFDNILSASSGDASRHNFASPATSTKSWQPDTSNLKSRRVAPNLVISSITKSFLDDHPSGSSSPTTPRSPAPVKSKNDIFFMSHIINKPVTKASAEEIEELKRGFSITPSPHVDILGLACENNSLRVDRNLLTKQVESLSRRSTSASLADQFVVPSQFHITSPVFQSQITDIVPPDLSQNIEIAYSFTRKNLIGEGRYSEVFRGQYRLKGSENGYLPCAIKRLHRGEDALLLALSEVYLALLLRTQTEFVAKVLGVKEEEDKFEDKRVLVLFELAENGNLGIYTRRNRSKVTPSQWLTWAKQLAEAVQAMQDLGIVHHDIKPLNILLNSSLDVKLADFGNALFVPAFSPQEINFHTANSQSPSKPPSNIEAQLQQELKKKITTGISESTSGEFPKSESSYSDFSLTDGIGKGTQSYSAAEMMNKSGTYSFPVDVYSLGVTLYAVLSGEDPFCHVRSSVEMLIGIKKGFFESGMNIENWTFGDGQKASESVIKLIHRCVARDEKERPTASELCRILDSIEVSSS